MTSLVEVMFTENEVFLAHFAKILVHRNKLVDDELIYNRRLYLATVHQNKFLKLKCLFAINRHELFSPTFSLKFTAEV